MVGVRQQRGRKISGRPRRGAARRHLGRLRSHLRRRSKRGVLGRILLGTAGKSPRLRRWVLAAALLGVALVPYPVQGASGVPPATACRSGCRAGVPSMVRWITPLAGAWNVAPGLAGTVPASGLAYAAVGGGLAAVGAGLTVTAYSSRTGALEWRDTLTGFPAGAVIVSVRAWPGRDSREGCRGPNVGLSASNHPSGASVWKQTSRRVAVESTESVIIGVDPHKASHTAVAIGDDERELGSVKVRATRRQVAQLLSWAEPFEKRTWAIESAGGLGYLLSQQLVAAGEDVIDVPATLASTARSSSRR